MSWSANPVVVSGSKYEEEIDAISPNLPEDMELSEQVRHQIDAAHEAAKMVIKTGAVGDPINHDFTIEMNGHANPDHEPVEGWVNDCTTVRVSQK